MDTTREEESNIPPYRLFNATTSSSSSSSFNSSPPDFLRNVKAAFKRHRMMPQVNLQPRRFVVPRRGTTNSSIIDSKMEESNKKGMHDMSLTTDNNHESASIAPPSFSNTLDEHGKLMPADAHRGQTRLSCNCGSNNKVDLPCLKCENIIDGRKKVQFALENAAISHGSVDQMDIITANLLTHMGSLALTEMECDVNNQLDVSSAPSHDVTEQNNQVNPMRNFLQTDFGHHMTSSSVAASTCATTTLINSVNAPMFNSTTHISKLSQHGSVHTGNSLDMNYQQGLQIDKGDPPYSSHISADQNPENKCKLSRNLECKEAESCAISKDPPPFGDKSTAGDIMDLKSQPPISNDQAANVKSVISKSGKNDKPASKKDASAPRKRSHDPDLFFKVNGKLYQRLGKIGSGGSSEVHKVISQDCTIYALKKIKLKGRDYATAYGFCQEIEYLNKLKGKNHIIQLIDYEVTDKALLKEVLSGCMSNKDGRVKEDGCIYMVLEYGEIDLAHMLSHKWRELDDSRSSTIDENWLRLYWQQILLAVKTIHEERIVHSDLKPANFLLVRGALKLIDFGIAKAIMSDTTNIQRDSQVGTLSYMSPEAFMCNETDANGNTIKCGRPSDIWSLGCILYQMVYGRTPFADYTTFWAKFKVITDPNHQIHYEPLSNPSLLDLLKKCLSWDRKERWTIPQLLQHPFLVPPVPPPSSDHHYNIIKLVADSCIEDPKTTMLCSRLQQLLNRPLPHIESEGLGSGSNLISLEQRRSLLDEISDLCLQLKELPANPKCV